MRTDTAVRNEGMRILAEQLGLVDGLFNFSDKTGRHGVVPPDGQLWEIGGNRVVRK
jgi:hypothetical protein